MATLGAVLGTQANGIDSGHPENLSGKSDDVNGSSLQAIIAKDESKGATVHTFDPDATPEQKAAAAGKARSQLAPVDGMPHLRKDKETSGRAVAIDTSSSSQAPDPTVTIKDIDKASREEGQAPGVDSMPGSIPTGAAPAVPSWMKTGWRQAGGLEPSAEEDRYQQHATILTDFLSEQTYGSWVQNAGVILFAVLATRFATSIGLGWGWMFIILATCSSYYTLSMSRTRQNARDDIQRELVKTRLVTETESADWLNGFLDRFWLIYEPVLSQTIVASIDATLATAVFGPVESIRLTTFTLGTKAPRIDYVRTFPKTPGDIVIMDWALSFTPNDLQDITPRQAAKRVNPKIKLAIRIGKGIVSGAMDILLEDMSFTGKMRVKLKLMTNFPHVQVIDLSFLEKPTFDYVLKQIGNIDINVIPGFAGFIRDMVHGTLGPMMYDPNVFTIDLQALLSGTPLDSAIGVLKVHISDARGLKAVKLGGGAPDPYVAVSLGAKEMISQTRTIPSSSNPSWNETQFILINNLSDILHLNLYDYNEHRADNLLGTVSQELATLSEDAEQEGMIGKILGSGKDRGELRYDLSYFPVLSAQKNAEGTLEPLPETNTGIVRLTIHQAKDLDTRNGELSPFAKIFLGGSKREVHKTKIMKHANQPIWESACEFLVPNKLDSTITVQVINSKEFASDLTLGKMTIALTTLLTARERQQDWFPLSGSQSGKVRLTAEWKPVAMTGSLSGAAAYVPPIGILRLWLKKAMDIKNVEAALGGKSDPYVRIMGSNKVLARTEVINNNLNPEWDSIVYVPIHSLRDNLILEVMDNQNIGKDRSLGYVEIKVADFATTNEGAGRGEYPYASRGVVQREDRIRLDKNNTYKGTLVYQGEFKAGLSLKGGVSFEVQKNELAMAAEEARENGNGPLTSGLPGLAGTPELETSGAAGHQRSVSFGGESAISTVGPKNGALEPVGNPDVGVDLSTEQLLSHQSGVLVFQVVSGQLARKGSLEILFDDASWPSFTSTRARSTRQTWDQIGEGFVRELEFSQIWFRINTADEGEKEDIIAEKKLGTREFLEQALNGTCEVLLSQMDGSNRSVVTLSARYVPVDIKLEPRESINNMGLLRVEVLSAKGLHAADRSGKSDPYVTFTLNGVKIFKSDTKKKTLAPVWNEAFEQAILSRESSQLIFEISDWDRVGNATHLGLGEVNLAQLEPFEMSEQEIPLRHEKGKDQGSISLRMIFQPEMVSRTRNKTSTFSTAGRAITQIGGLPVAAGKGVLHGGGTVVSGVGHGIGNVGHGIGSVGGFAGRRIGLIKKKDKSGKEILVPADAGDVAEPIEELEERLPPSPVVGRSNGGYEVENNGNGNGGGQAGSVFSSSAFISTEAGAGPKEPGILGVTVVEAKDLKGGQKPYVVVKIGGKTHKTGHAKGVDPAWNETFSFNVVPGTEKLTINVLDHHTIGKDDDLGEAEVDIWKHIQPSFPNADVNVELVRGTGLLRLRLDWTPGTSPMPKSLGARGRTASIGSKGPDSPSRFNMMKRKEKVDGN